MRLAITLGWMIAACRSGPAPVPAATPPAQASVAGPSAPRVAWFGTWRDNPEASRQFHRGQTIYAVEGVTFGWRIKTSCTGPVKFRETMRLPSPGDWPDLAELPGTIITDDSMTATTTDYAACRQGWVEHRWTVAKWDPAGTYVITVELDGYAPTTFRPKFVAPP